MYRRLWEENWSRNIITSSIFTRELDSVSLAWQKIMAGVKSHFGSISCLKVIEIGSGIGRASARFARAGADVTLVDFSSSAISKAKECFYAADLRANFLVADIFSLPQKFKDRFDVSISFGVVEHFRAQYRKKVFSIHTEVIRKGGIGIIGTPNTYGFPYIAWMGIARLLGVWEVGYERPYTAREIRDIIRELGYKYKRWGTPFSETVNTYIVNKLNILLTNLVFFRRLRVGRERMKVYRFIPYIRDRWSALDDLMGYHIVVIYK